MARQSNLLRDNVRSVDPKAALEGDNNVLSLSRSPPSDHGTTALNLVCICEHDAVGRLLRKAKKLSHTTFQKALSPRTERRLIRHVQARAGQKHSTNVLIFTR
jgi:hypothetical protein